MKSKYILKLVGCLGLALCVSSCEDFLDQTDPNTLTTGIYWESLDDCNENLTSVYNIFKNENMLQLKNGLCLSDMAWPNGHSTNAWPKIADAFHMRTYDNTNSYIENQWTYLYMGIFRANQVIEGLEGLKDSLSSDEDLAEYDLIYGQAIFFRALFHFYAYSIFNEGNVPLVTSVPVTEEDFYVQCTSREIIQDFIRSEMEIAEALLPSKGDSDDWSDAGRPRSEAASAILGLTYLHENEPAYLDTTKKPNYEKAGEYFKKIIDNANYSLANVYENMTETGENNNESILEIQYTLDYNSEYATSSQSNLSSSLSQYTCAPSVGTSGGQRAIPAYWLFRTYGVEPVDKTIESNKVYLKTDAHGDIYYWNNDTDYVVSGEDTDGSIYLQYYVVKKYTAELDGLVYDVSKHIDTREEGKYYVFYKKLYVTDTSSRTPIIPDYDEWLASYDGSTAAKSPYVVYQTVSATNMSSRPYNVICNGTWNIYNEGTEEDPIYYRYRTNSLRASYSCVMATDEDMEYYGEPRMLDNATMNEAHGWFRKYSNWDTRSKESDVTNSRSAINLRMIRLASIYLWYAECLLEGGETSDQTKVNEAMMYINRLRKRAGTVLIGSPAEDTAGEFTGLSFQSEGDPDDSYDKEANEGWTASSYDFADLYWTGDATIINTASTVMEHLKHVEGPLEMAQDGYYPMQRFIDLRRWNIVKERFTEIASQQIFELRYIYNSILTTTVSTAPTSAGSYIIDFDSTVPRMATATYDTQFGYAAQGYSDYYAYLPIPSSELIANPNIGTIIDTVEDTDE